MKNIKAFHFFLIWMFGFFALLCFALLSFDLFMEGLVFEWLEWNETTKNDWFFALWWGFVVIWFIFGAKTLHEKVTKKLQS